MTSNFDELFKKFADKRDKMKALFTIVTYNTSQQEIIHEIEHRLRLAKTIKYPKKRICVSNRLFNFKTYLKDSGTDETTKNTVFFVSDDVDEITLSKEWLQVLKNFDVDKFIFRYDETFDIPYLKSLLTDTNYREVIYVKNNLMRHIYLNSTKKKIYYETESKNLDVEEYVKNNIKEPCIIHGISVALKNLKSDKHYIYTKMLTDEEIADVFKKEQVGAVHKQLDEYMTYITNEKLMHRIVFGKDVQKKIISKELKTVFCSPEMYTKILEKVPQEYLNFDLKLVESLEKGDSGDKLKTQYMGVIGVTYY